MSDGARTLLLISPPDDVDAVHELVEALWLDHPGVDAMDRMAFETALIELASNVLQHSDAGSGVTCVLSIGADSDRLHARLSDTAEAGGITLAGRAMPDELAESGRGIALIQALVDDLHYERVGDRNLWSIEKKRRTA